MKKLLEIKQRAEQELQDLVTVRDDLLKYGDYHANFKRRSYRTILRLCTALELCIKQRNDKGCTDCHISGETAELNTELEAILSTPQDEAAGNG